MAIVLATEIFLEEMAGIKTNTNSHDAPPAIIDHTVTNTGRTSSATATYLASMKLYTPLVG